MNFQEQEEMDYQMGCGNELQNAYALSCMNRRSDDSGKIELLLAEGKFIVVSEGTEYCPSTDAIMGIRMILCGQYDTREEADKACFEESEYDHDEVRTYVLPLLPAKVVVNRDDFSEIPF